MLIAAVAIIGSIFSFTKGPGDEGREPSLNTRKSYSNDIYGINFEYPANYFLEEREVGTGERGHYQIMLTEDTEENRRLRQGEATIAREGPTAITIDFYQNNIEKLELYKWLTETNQSNFKLSDGSYMSLTQSGKEAVSYTWDGLYTGDTVALLYKDNIVALSVTYLGPDDEIRKDFKNVVLTTLTFK